MDDGLCPLRLTQVRSAANMKNLKPCPCGEIPNSLLVADNGAKWAYAYGDCCNEWHIEFRTMYHPIESEECIALAIEAWNEAKRSAAEQLRALDFAICAPEYHALLDRQGDRFCRACGQPLSQ